jgi:hypothetical protein
VVIGLSVTLFDLVEHRLAPAVNLVSTSVTPPSVMNTATLPPLNVAGFPGVDVVRT